MTTKRLRTVEHPLVASKLLQMRQPVKDCPQRMFTRLLRELGGHMAYEVARELPTDQEVVELERGGDKLKGRILDSNRFIVVPILRSGILMADGFREVLPAALIGHIGIHVDKTNASISEYLVSLPGNDTSDKVVMILDPVVATGGTALTAISRVMSIRPSRIIFVSLVCSLPGSQRIHKHYPDVTIYCAALDKVLENGRVYPGLGSVSERIFGFKTLEVELTNDR